MTDTDSYARQLILSEPLRAPVVTAAIRALDPPPGSHGLDVGCGLGAHTLRLAEAVGPSGQVTGLDRVAEFLTRARDEAGRRGLTERVTFREGDLHRLPFPDRRFDWLWSMDCVGYGTPGPGPLLRNLTRVVKPGGRIAILAWSSQQLLPGHPRLEARLNATSAGIAPFRHGSSPEGHFLRAPGWFREAGLEEASARTLVRDVHAPLERNIREALISLLDMRWGEANKEVPPEIWEDYQRLRREDSPDFILDLPDYYAFFTYSMFLGRVAGGPA